MSQLTSTLIDDEQLIEELRRYGEKNLPTLPSGGSTSTRSKNKNVLNDTNREIYFKKLNHYRAKEKAKSNPSRQYLKQQQKMKHEYDEDTQEEEDEVQIIEQENDVIPLDSNETQYEYVKVSNAHTSPLSMSTYVNSFNDHNNDSLPSSSTQLPRPKANLNYVSLKERLELDKTLSKYRSEINSILTNSIVKNRTTSSNLLADNDIIYTGSVQNNGVSSTLESKTLYCPKPTINKQQTETKSIFNTIKSKFTSPTPIAKTQQVQFTTTDSQNYLAQRVSPRAGLNKHKEPVYPTPNKEPSFKSKLSSYFQNKLFPFISHLWLQFSKLLPYLILIIFTIIALQYFRMKFLDESTNFIRQAFNSFQSSSKSKNDPKIEHYYCSDIKDTQCSQTKALAREVIDYLRVRSGQVECSPLVESNLNAHLDQDHSFPIDFIEKCVHLNQILNYVSNERKLIKNKKFESEAMDSVLKAVLRNPHWNLRLLNASYMDTNQINQVTYLVSKVSSKSLTCRFKELMHFLYIRAIMLASFVITLFLGYLTFKAVKVRRIEKDKKFFALIKQVTELVEKQYELSLLDTANIKPYIAISHVYDTLIEPSQRASKKKQWNEVIKFIEDHESRIHLETQFIDGEETLVWKWVVPKHHESVNSFKYVNIQNKNEGIGLANSKMITNDQIANNAQSLNKDLSNKENTNTTAEQVNKSNTLGWQGDAFNRSEKLLHSPTPCLKIRGMFDQSATETDPLFAVKIHNDILEKCFNTRTNDSILHIACDKKSKEGCVYVKCFTNESAGRVYQALNGTWYNGKLLNVKFLRSDRYLERFPESINFNTPLQMINV